MESSLVTRPGAFFWFRCDRLTIVVRGVCRIGRLHAPKSERTGTL